ncbi:hypothetical protein [Flavobacterium beibuense]|uniref:Uncharacterized protein n=1 Tax=Flavobacterium beibuense TaxID=657326 RepID=A0A444W726_9FLAO|nr:hypothetical protein [Flavobacterium beibuense]RYJ41572.1 hypothetical protein NU09_2946 [Flavobacterium beibuense]
MVRIINYLERTSDEGKKFFVLELQGGMEMVKSQVTGSFYATAKKATIPSTFDELTCQALIGTDIAGAIKKVSSEPYEYTIRDTGETIILHHRYEYEPEEVSKQEYSPEKSETTVDEFMKGRTEKETVKNNLLVNAE